MPEIAGTGCVENLFTWVPTGQWFGLGNAEIPDPVLHAARLPEMHQVHIDAAVLDAVIANDILRGQPQSVIDRMVYVPAEPTLDWTVAVSRADALGLPVLVRDATFDVLDPRVQKLVDGSGVVLVTPAPGKAAKTTLTPPVTDRAPRWLRAKPRAAMNETQLRQLSLDVLKVVASHGPTDDPNLCTVLLRALRDELFPRGLLPERARDDMRVGTWRGEVEFSAASRWGRAASVEEIIKALKTLEAGSTAFVLVDRAFGKGHAVAMYKLADGELRWVDLSGSEGAKVIPVAGPAERLVGAHPTEGGVALRVLIANAEGRRVPLSDSMQSTSAAQALIGPPINREYAGSALVATFSNRITFDGAAAHSNEGGEILALHEPSGSKIVTQGATIDLPVVPMRRGRDMRPTPNAQTQKIPVVNLSFVSDRLRNVEQEDAYHEPEAATEALQQIETRLAGLTFQNSGRQPIRPLTEILSGQGFTFTELGKLARVGIWRPEGEYHARSSFEVGVSTDGLYPFLKQVLRTTQRAAAARHLKDGLSLGKKLAARFFGWREFGPDLSPEILQDLPESDERLDGYRPGRALAGYVALLYSHAAALATDKIPYPEKVAALSGTAIYDIRDRLPVETQAYLEFDRQFIVEAFERRSKQAIAEIEEVANVLNPKAGIYFSDGLPAGNAHKAPPSPTDTHDVQNGMLPLILLTVASDGDRGHQKSVDDMLREHAELTKIARHEFDEQINAFTYSGPAIDDSVSAYDATPEETPIFEGGEAAHAAEWGNLARHRHSPEDPQRLTRGLLAREFPTSRLNFFRGEHYLGPGEQQLITSLVARVVDIAARTGPLELHIEAGGVGRHPALAALTGDAAERASVTGRNRGENIAQSLQPHFDGQLALRSLRPEAVRLVVHNRGAGPSSAPNIQLKTSEDHRAAFVWLLPQVSPGPAAEAATPRELFDEMNNAMVTRGLPPRTHADMLAALAAPGQPFRQNDLEVVLRYFAEPVAGPTVESSVLQSGADQHHPQGERAVAEVQHDLPAPHEVKPSIGGLYDLLTHVRAMTSRPAAARHIEDGLSFGNELAARFFVWRELGPQEVGVTRPGGAGIPERLGRDWDVRRLAGYTALLYAHAAALAQSVIYDEQPSPDDLLAVQSRSAMGDIRDELPREVRAYLAFDRKFITDTFLSKSQSTITELEATRVQGIGRQYRQRSGPKAGTFVVFATVPVHTGGHADLQSESETSRQRHPSALDYLIRGLDSDSAPASSHWPGFNVSPGGATSFDRDGELARFVVEVSADSNGSTTEDLRQLQLAELNDLVEDAARNDLLDQRQFVVDRDNGQLLADISGAIADGHTNGHVRLGSSGDASNWDGRRFEAGLNLFGPARHTEPWYRIGEFAETRGRPLVGLVPDDEAGTNFGTAERVLRSSLEDDLLPHNSVIVVLGRSAKIDDLLADRGLTVIRRAESAAQVEPVRFHPRNGWNSRIGWEITTPTGSTNGFGALLNSWTIEATFDELHLLPSVTAEAGLSRANDWLTGISHRHASRDDEGRPTRDESRPLTTPTVVHAFTPAEPSTIDEQVVAPEAPSHRSVEEDALSGNFRLPPGSHADSEKADRLFWVGPQPILTTQNRLRRAVDEPGAPVIFLGGNRGATTSDDDLRDLRRLVQQFALKKQQPVVVTEISLSRELTDVSETYGVSLVHRVPKAQNSSLDPVWVVRGSDGVSDGGEVYLTALLLNRAAERATPTADRTNPAVVRLLLAPDRAATLDVLNTSRDELNSQQARNDLATIVERVGNEDSWFRGFTPLLGELNAAGTAEIVLDYQETSDVTARKHLLIGGQGREIPVTQRVNLIADSGHGAAGASKVMEAVNIMFRQGVNEAVGHLLKAGSRLDVDDRQSWVDAITDLARQNAARNAEFVQLANAVLEC
ncbi:hypothetical protein ACLQ24_00710 [Micromonospora sp. DT4]|uniref:hypothetical protein n=1 Tax=Micromonospora sp. DT4 TaxID=3393438 RepID=UPI003CF408B1